MEGRSRQERKLSRDNHLADWPKRQSGKLQMRPRKRNTNDGDREQDRRNQVGERQPPAGKDEPNDIAQHAKWPGAYVLLASVFGSGDCLLSKGTLNGRHWSKA
jgi:hypothetical protein